MSITQNRLLVFAGIAGLLGVALGAFGAHALRESLAQRQATALWETAVLYHLIHAVGLLALAGWATQAPGDAAQRPARLPAALSAAAVCWIGGSVLFSGSLYGLALGAPRAFGWITPLGGLSLLAGWGLIAIHGWRSSRRS